MEKTVVGTPPATREEAPGWCPPSLQLNATVLKELTDTFYIYAGEGSHLIYLIVLWPSHYLKVNEDVTNKGSHLQAAPQFLPICETPFSSLDVLHLDRRHVATGRRTGGRSQPRTGSRSA